MTVYNCNYDIKEWPVRPEQRSGASCQRVTVAFPEPITVHNVYLLVFPGLHKHRTPVAQREILSDQKPLIGLLCCSIADLWLVSVILPKQKTGPHAPYRDSRRHLSVHSSVVLVLPKIKLACLHFKHKYLRVERNEIDLRNSQGPVLGGWASHSAALTCHIQVLFRVLVLCFWCSSLLTCLGR